MTPLDELLAEVRQCRLCADDLPLGPRPIFQMSSTARILIASQAPGTKAHLSGLPFDDASVPGAWLAIRTVSYTPLDVYKRQEQRHRAVANQPLPARPADQPRPVRIVKLRHRFTEVRFAGTAAQTRC